MQCAKLQKQDGAHRSPNSVLSLDKSTEPWLAQIGKASGILDIDLDATWSKVLKKELAESRREDFAVDPRIEWTLRWLLKGLEPNEDQPSPQSREFKSWVLLRELIARCPTATVARLLKAHGIINILGVTFNWLYGLTVKKLESQTTGNGIGSGDDVSSSETLVTSQGKVSKKRKRASPTVKQPGSHLVSLSFDTVFRAVCGALRQIMQLTVHNPEQPEDYAIEHVKHALRVPPELLAMILGNAFSITDNLLQMPGRNSNRKHPESSEGLEIHKDTAYGTCLSPLFDLWDLHHASSWKLSASLSHNACLSYCTIPSLQLLHNCQAWSSSDPEKEFLSDHLQRLLVTYVILPIRTSLLTSKGSADELRSHTELSEKFVRELQAHHSARKGSDSNADQGTKQYFQIMLLSLFFGLAINANPRHTQILRQAENAWLEELFGAMDSCAAMLLPPKAPNTVQKEHKRLLMELLQSNCDAHVTLGGDTLEKVIQKASGLFDEVHDAQIEWRLISLCLSMDADVFVHPASTIILNENYSYRPPNRFLTALLTAITNKQPSDLDDRKYVLEHVLIPLLKGFSTARDLPGFIEHWKEQLSVVQQRSSSSEQVLAKFKRSVWEDSTLLAAVATMIESLTADQIHELLSKASSDLSVSSTEESFPLQSLVVSQVVFCGLTREDTINKMTKDAQSIIRLLEILITKSDSLGLRYRWRLWRTMTAIVQRWPPSAAITQIRKSAHSAVCYALDHINRLEAWQPPEQVSDLTEDYHCFIFILSNAWLGDHVWEDERFSCRQKALQAIHKMLNLMQPFCQRVENGLWENVTRPEDATPDVTMSESYVPSIDSLYLGCVNAILSSPKIVEYVVDNQRHGASLTGL